MAAGPSIDVSGWRGDVRINSQRASGHSARPIRHTSLSPLLKCFRRNSDRSFTADQAVLRHCELGDEVVVLSLHGTAAIVAAFG